MAPQTHLLEFIFSRCMIFYFFVFLYEVMETSPPPAFRNIPRDIEVFYRLLPSSVPHGNEGITCKTHLCVCSESLNASELKVTTF